MFNTISVTIEEIHGVDDYDYEKTDWAIIQISILHENNRFKGKSKNSVE